MTHACLRATARSLDGPVADGSRTAASGRSLGATWARERATLEELKEVAAIRETDWTALALADGHSLIRSLQEAGVVPAEHAGGLALERDPFVDELVEGAGAVYDEVRPHLELIETVRPRE